MGARFRRLDPRLWNDEGFRACSLEEKLIALYMFTAQSNRIGLFSFSPGKACEELELSAQTFRKGSEKVCRTFHWEWDERARVLFIPTWWKYNAPENPNVLKSYLRDLHDLPRTPLLTRFSANLQYLPITFHQTFQEGLPQPSPQRIGDKETDTEIEKETEREAPSHSIGVTAKEIQNRWNAIAGVKPCKEIGETIRERIQARIKKHSKSEWWDSFFQRVQASDFLCGRTHGSRGPFRASLAWVLAPTNLDKLLAGDYDPNTSNGHGLALTCTKRVQGPGDQFLRPCGQPASPACRPSEPRCPEHLRPRSQPQAGNHVSH